MLLINKVMLKNKSEVQLADGSKKPKDVAETVYSLA